MRSILHDAPITQGISCPGRWRIAFLWPLLLTLVLCGRTAWSAAPLKVFVSIPPQKYFVERLGGKHVSVSVIVEPGRSPATYEPSPLQMSRLSGASLYFAIGVPFEDVWMTRIHAANPGMKIIALQEGIPLRGVDQVGDAGEGEGRKDPHIWTSPQLVQHMAGRIRDALIMEDPGHRSDYEASYARFTADLEALDRYIRDRLRGLMGRSFMVFHPSWGYFADNYGLRQIPIERGGKMPGARTLQRVIELGRREGVKVIFVQEQFSTRTAETVARALGARIARVDPVAEDYVKNMRHVADLFAEALGSR